MTKIDTITIPPEALEAAAEAEYYARFGASAGPWNEAPDWIKHQCRAHARAACLAMLRAWPWMRVHRSSVPPRPPAPRAAIILPLHKEKSNADG